MIDNLPPLREIIQKYGLYAHKALGQCFLFDLNLTTKIANQAGALTDKKVLEIGPGPGGLTRALLAQGAYVTAIERDERFFPILQELQNYYPGRLNVIFGDALKQDYQNLFSKSKDKVKVIANLPYNIGTKLFIDWICCKTWPPFYESLTLMFQKEVAERIVALPNTEHYGRLSVLSNWRAHNKIVMRIPPSAFTPAPKVFSAVIQSIPNENPLSCDIKKLEKITQYAFAQRRKTLRQSLKPLGGEALLIKSSIEATRRPETLSFEEFVQLANQI